jgi:hypothetical protein
VVAGLVALVVVRWVWLQIVEWLRIGTHRARVERLQAFARELKNGALDARGFYSGGTTTVCGELDGRSLEVGFRLGHSSWITYNLKIKEGTVELDALRPALLARLFGQGPVIAVQQGGRTAELESPLRHLLLERGLQRVMIRGAWIRAETALEDGDLALDRLLDVCRTMSRIARVCDPRATASYRAGDELGRTK